MKTAVASEPATPSTTGAVDRTMLAKAVQVVFSKPSDDKTPNLKDDQTSLAQIWTNRKAEVNESPLAPLNA